MSNRFIKRAEFDAELFYLRRSQTYWAVFHQKVETSPVVLPKKPVKITALNESEALEQFSELVDKYAPEGK